MGKLTYNPQKGTILIDRRDISDYKIKALRSNIGLVSQDTFLFGYSIYDNIRIGNMNVCSSDVIQAAKAAYAHDFIMNLPEQYNTKIGERGSLISGGERQRIALARVFLKNPKIIILDEATSSLDTHSEYIVKKALEQLYVDRTVVIITHRLSAVVSLDKIIYINDGRLIGLGSHYELYNSCEEYRNLYDKQFEDINVSRIP